MPRKATGPRLVRRGDRRQWAIYYLDGGRPRHLSTGAENEDAAKRELAEFIASRERPTPATTVTQVLDRYIEARRTVVAAPERLDEARKPLDRLLGYRRASTMAPAESRAYTHSRRAEGKKTGTIRRELGLLRAGLRWAARENVIDRAPAVELPASPPVKDRWLTRDEAARLLGAIRAYHLALFTRIALATGARTAAILALTWDRVDLDARLIDFSEPGRIETSKRRATVPINDDLFAVLDEARERATTDYVIEWGDRQVKRVVKGIGAAAKRAGLKSVTAHTLRHTAATWMAQAGTDLWRIGGVLGHADPRTTAKYTKHHPDYLKDAVAALSLPSGKLPGKVRKAKLLK